MNPLASGKSRLRIALPRPRIQRAFAFWYWENRKRFSVPVRLGQRTFKGIEIVIPGFGNAIHGYLNRDGIGIPVLWQGECIDLLQSFDAVPLRKDKGYVCGLCLPEHLQYYSDRESLWREHVFEPFLTWINSDLALAQELCLYRMHGGSWAKLGSPDVDDQEYCIDRIVRSGYSITNSTTASPYPLFAISGSSEVFGCS